MAPTSGGVGAMTSSAAGAGTSVLAVSAAGASGNRTSEIGRLTESRGTAASSPTPGSPAPNPGASDRGRSAVATPDDCVKLMPDDAV